MFDYGIVDLFTIPVAQGCAAKIDSDKLLIL